MKLVLDLGIDPSRIIFAHPCKAVSALQFASRHGIPRTTFDNADELDKIKEHALNLRLLLRIHADDDTALVSLGNKFGAPLDTTTALLQRAKDLGLTVEGVSFHIGGYKVFSLPFSLPFSLNADQRRIRGIKCRCIRHGRTRREACLPQRQAARI